MKNYIDNFGTIKNQFNKIDKTKDIDTLLELIDNKTHSASNKVSINFISDTSNKIKEIVICYENMGTENDMKNMAIWNVSNKKQNESDIPFSGLGTKYYFFHNSFLGTHNIYNIDYENNNNNIKTRIVSSKIKEQFNRILDNNNDDVNEFTTILDDNNSTNTNYDYDEIPDTIKNVIKNCPFDPNKSKLIIHSKLKNNIFNYEEETFKKILKIKYYHEIFYNKFELFIGYNSDFKQIINETSIDIIGLTKAQDKLLISVYQEHNNKNNKNNKNDNNIIFEIDNKFYKSNTTNKSKKGRQEIIEINDYNIDNKKHQLIFNIELFHFEMDKDYKNYFLENKTPASYRGLYCKLDNSLTSYEPISIAGFDNTSHVPHDKAKHFRLILLPTEKGKRILGFDGCKTMLTINHANPIYNLLDIFIKSTVKGGKNRLRLYDRYLRREEYGENWIIPSSNNIEKNNNKIGYGEWYLAQLGPQLFKVGIATYASEEKKNNTSTLTRYRTKSHCDKLDETIKNYHYEYPDIKKSAMFNSGLCDNINVNLWEQKLKSYIFDNKDELEFTIFDSKNGHSDCREYFLCKKRIDKIYTIFQDQFEIFKLKENNVIQ